jgi:hypothetical protein
LISQYCLDETEIAGQFPDVLMYCDQIGIGLASAGL